MSTPTIFYNIYISSILPWFLIFVLHCMHLRFVGCFATLFYIISFFLVLHPKKYLNCKMVLWNHVKRTSELMVLLNCFTGYSWWGFFIWVFVLLLLIKLPKYITKKMQEPSIHCTFLLLVAMHQPLNVLSYVNILISMPRIRFSKRVEYTKKEVRLLLRLFHTRALVQMWCTLTIECADVVSFFVCVSLSLVFLTYLIMTEGGRPIHLNETIVQNIAKLPKNYPFPCNFKYAIDNCDVAKKVFKDHCA